MVASKYSIYKIYIYKCFIYQRLTEVVFMYFPVSALLIEFMILSIVNREDSYGYEISQTIKLVADIKESTLYPILKKLEKAGYVTTYSAEYQGRKRKYYSITEEGKTQMVYLQGEWKSYRDTIDDIIEGRKKG